MGGIQSPLAKYCDGFNEVASKSKWKKHMVINLDDASQFTVVDIRGETTGSPGLLRVGRARAGIVFVYTYKGDQIVFAKKYPLYDIYMMKTSPKVGGDLIDGPPPNFTRGGIAREECSCSVQGGADISAPKRLKSADGRAPRIVTAYDPYPDDNIAE